jgi:putative transposase
MVEPDDRLSLRRQCELLQVSRSGWYYEPSPVSAEDLALMRRIDELHLKLPFYGSRRLSQALRSEGRIVNRKHVQRLMQRNCSP